MLLSNKVYAIELRQSYFALKKIEEDITEFQKSLNLFPTFEVYEHDDWSDEKLNKERFIQQTEALNRLKDYIEKEPKVLIVFLDKILDTIVKGLNMNTFYCAGSKNSDDGYNGMLMDTIPHFKSRSMFINFFKELQKNQYFLEDEKSERISILVRHEESRIEALKKHTVTSAK